MKQVFFTALMLISFSMTANSTNPNKNSDPKTINTQESSIIWTGKKVTGEHTGKINIKSGNLDFENEMLVGGQIIIDMNSITCTDLAERGAQKLVGHLKSDDFFGVPNNPTAMLKITTATFGKTKGSYEITADVTIKGTTKPITFSANVNAGSATATVIIDRTDFDVRYGSGSFFDDLGDKTIYDDFELIINLKY